MQDLERQRGNFIAVSFLPLFPTSQGCVCVSEDKRVKKAAKNTMETATAEAVMGSNLIASLLTQINPEICFTLSTG